MITSDKTGGRTIQLFIPFDYKGKKVESIVLSPLMFGHTLRWGAGDWSNSVAFLVEIAGVEEGVIRSLRYPDADRVMEAFITMLPNEMRQDIAEGRIPSAKPKEEAAVTGLEEMAAKLKASAANGGGQPVTMQGPGVPLPTTPETGFDISDDREQP